MPLRTGCEALLAQDSETAGVDTAAVDDATVQNLVSKLIDAVIGNVCLVGVTVSRPEYTGEKRCTPWTLVTVVIAPECENTYSAATQD